MFLTRFRGRGLDKIGTAARITGLDVMTLRNWEKACSKASVAFAEHCFKPGLPRRIGCYPR
jgi:hypothetical protein